MPAPPCPLYYRTSRPHLSKSQIVLKERVIPGLIAFRLLLAVILYWLLCQAAGAAEPARYLERLVRQEAEAVLKFDMHSKTAVKNWFVYCSLPPELSRQNLISAHLGLSKKALRANTVKEHSESKRQLLFLHIGSDQSCTKSLPLEARFKLRLYSTKLLEGKMKGKIETLSPEELRENTEASFSIDYKSREFKRFLLKNQLSRRSAESDLEFARRSFDFICSKYIYHWDQLLDRRVSLTCLRNNTDCAGICYLYCGILRANGIPARALIGRFARSSSKLEDYSGSFACHVRVEFYARDIGWVPADPAAALGVDKSLRKREFGFDAGDFIVMHVNPDLLLDSKVKGIKLVRSMPDFQYWLDFENASSPLPRQISWTVRSTTNSR